LPFDGTQRARFYIVRAMKRHRHLYGTVPKTNMAPLGAEHKEPSCLQLFDDLLAVQLRTIPDVIHPANTKKSRTSAVAWLDATSL